MLERDPNREEVRAAILWFARMFVSHDGSPFSGPLRVCVVKTVDHETCTIKPRTVHEGSAPPAWLAVEEGAPERVKDRSPTSASELLRVLLSPDEDKLLTDLATHQPCKASAVKDRCKAVLGTSDFWAVWGQLQKRRLVEQDDEGLYGIGPNWLREWLTQKKAASEPNRPDDTRTTSAVRSAKSRF